MVSKKDVENVLFATLNYYEVFRKFVHATMPMEINTKMQMDVAVILYTTGPQSMTALARRINVAPEQITRAVRVLREGGIVACEKKPDNRRMVIASLTDKGSDLVEDHLRKTNERILDYLKGMPAAEAEQLISASCAAVKVFMKHELDATPCPILPLRSPHEQKEGE